MKQKKWKNCPVCGAKDSMHLKKNLVQIICPEGYPSLEIKTVQGFQCNQCKESILTIAACRRVDHLVGEHKAQIDSKRIVAAELMDVSKAKNILHISRQRLHQMMDEGKIPYVYINHSRIPIREGVEKFQSSLHDKFVA